MADRRMVIVTIEGGCVAEVHQPLDVDVHVIDLDTEVADEGDLCDCALADRPHFHADYPGELEGADKVLEALKALTEWGRTYTSPLDANSPHDLLVAAVAAIAGEPKPCAVCKVRPAVAGVYCQPCLDQETEGMGSDELF